LFNPCITCTYTLTPFEPFEEFWACSCWVWSNSHKRFKRRSRLKCSFYKYCKSLYIREGLYFANIREQGHNWHRGIIGTTLDIVTYKIWSSGPWSFRQDEFWKFHFENLFFLPFDRLVQPTGTIWTTLVGDHKGIISVKFG